MGTGGPNGRLMTRGTPGVPRVFRKKNFSMFNAGLFGSDVDYVEVCENIDKKRCRAPSRQSEQPQAGQGTWK